ncbi:MAG TPA: hypothetical protein DGH68_10455 [Bacteroidetes bacterium]|jgi:hypothetical protein|nr:hypothetical protein [Bacteroidota bacterium]
MLSIRLLLVTTVFGIAVILADGCKDMGNAPPLPPLSVGQTILNVVVGDSVSQVISGGVAPYSIISNSDPAKVAVAIANSALKVRAVAVGAAAIVVGDNSSPQQTATVNVTVVAAPVSFSGQIQPIFNAGCAVSGCHLPGGSGPMSLATGVSYGNLVGVNATNGPCAGDKRVQPGSAGTSALIKRLEGNCGTRMPIGSSPLSTGQIQLIRDWITQGAQNN